MDKDQRDTESPVGMDVESDGDSLIDAIMKKYGDMESGLHDMGDVQVYFSAPAKKNKDSKDESSGQLALKLPTILVLNRCKICRAGDRERIAALCRPVQELDLAENSLKCWTEIGSITNEFPKLEFLNLSSNPLHRAPAPDGTLATMTTVRRLVLNNTKLPWETVHGVLRATPSLDELHLSLNDFATVAPSPEPHPNLRLLQFNGNGIERWAEVQKLGRMFPALESLILMQNGIRELEGGSGSAEEVFPALRTLCISETLVDSWEELDRLNGFPALTELLVQGIPLLQGSTSSLQREEEQERKRIRQLVVARLGRLLRLNRSPVTETERDEAERTFIRRFRDSAERPGRYEELVQKHGNVQELAKVDLRARTIFRCEMLCEERLQDIEVNVKHTVQQLRKQIAPMVGLPASKFRIFFMEAGTNRDVVGSTELNLLTRFLFNYRIGDGACFYIVPKGV